MHAGCVCAARPCCFARGSRVKVHQKFGKPRHIGDRRKARDKTSQTVATKIGISLLVSVPGHYSDLSLRYLRAR